MSRNARMELVNGFINIVISSIYVQNALYKTFRNFPVCQKTFFSVFIKRNVKMQSASAFIGERFGHKRREKIELLPQAFLQRNGM